MSYEKKSLDILKSIEDAIYYEEGRLAFINKYGTFFSDEDKSVATPLIIEQRVNLDRLFEIYKSELSQLVASINKTSSNMDSLLDKLISSSAVSVANNETPVMTSTTDYTETTVTPEPEAVVVSGSAVSSPVPEGVTENVPFDPNATLNSGATTVVSPVSAEDGVMTGSEVVSLPDSSAPMVDNNLEDVKVNNDSMGNEITQTVESVTPVREAPVVEPVSEVKNEESSAVQLNDAIANGVEPNNVTITDFVLSPIDEGVVPIPTKEEKTVEESSVVASDQQTSSVDLMQTDLIDSTLPEPQESEVERYSRTGDGSPRAILVTKAQYDKLLVSRVSQKGKIYGEGVSEINNDVSSEHVGLPAIENGEQGVSVSDVVVPPMAEAVSADTPLASTNNTNSMEAGFLPMINDSADNSSAVPVENEKSEVTLPTIDNGSSESVISLPATEPLVNPNDLQAMIEQGNNLYKEGKVAEAQEVFAKVESINKEIQPDSAAPVAEGSVLVMK